MSAGPGYLDPYHAAVRKDGPGFSSLLWASPQTQEQRFAALLRGCEFDGRNVLDAGCGHADLLRFLISRGIFPAHYVGLEAVAELARIARARMLPGAQIIEGDFVADPARMLVGADVVVFCGSLNTLPEAVFYQSLRHAWDATADTLAFNFLSSPRLAGQPWLTWHEPARVLAFCRQLSPDARLLDDYLDGDATIVLHRPREH